MKSLTTEQQEAYQTLLGLAKQVPVNCPDMKQLARGVAHGLLARHDLQPLEPDTVYLHRFQTAVSNPSTFSGWDHVEHPYASYTLPQLVMHRFDADDQDNADLLSYRTGFYRDDADKGVYDERNEVCLAPRDALQYFWQVDFASDFNTRLGQFWEDHADDYRTLAKINFLGKVLEVRNQQPGSALAKCCAKAAVALLGEHPWPPTLSQLREEVAVTSALRVCTFDIGGHIASDILRVVWPDGRQLLYLPGDTEPLQLFDSPTALYWWVLTQNNHAENRARFVGHFSLQSRGETQDASGLNHLIDLLYAHWGHSDASGLNTLDQPIAGDAFTWLRDQARQRMLDDAQFSLRSNADLRKQLWIGYLKAFSEVFSPMAAVDWPVALAVVGAGLAETGLNVDQAINGHTTQERQAGVIAAIVAAIDTVFNATFLLGAPDDPFAGFAEDARDETPLEPQSGETGADDSEEDRPATLDELTTWVPEPLRPSTPAQMLAPFETNVLLTGNAGTGELEGVYVEQGQFYVEIDGLAYQVRRIPELKTWAIVDPQNPFAFHNSLPIRLEQGRWYALPRGGLRGGMLSQLKAWGRSVQRPEVAPLPDSPYELPAEIRPLLKDETDRRVLDGDFADIDRPEHFQAAATFRQLRDQLASDAQAFMQSVELPTRPVIPELPAAASAREVLKRIYAASEGLVIGEGHSAEGSKRLLIDNMGQLRKLGVKTLYMEHYLTDLQQAELDSFNRTGKMSEALSNYIAEQDAGHLTDRTGRYTFRRVMVEAQKHGVRIQPIDCMASYRATPVSAQKPSPRIAMMNYYAHQVIRADQQVRGPSRWVALVGSAHANTYYGVPGLAETEGAIGLRVEDVTGGAGDEFDADPGLDAKDHMGRTHYLKSDLRLRAAVAAAAPSKPPARTLETLLVQPGDYTLEKVNGQQYVVNRSRDLTLRRTLVRRDGSRFYVEQPEWSNLHQRRLANLNELKLYLKMRGMNYRS